MCQRSFYIIFENYEIVGSLGKRLYIFNSTVVILVNIA